MNKGGGADHFMDRLEEWLRVNKLLTKGPGMGSNWLRWRALLAYQIFWS